jgi:hypothetical protein
MNVDIVNNITAVDHCAIIQGNAQAGNIADQSLLNQLRLTDPADSMVSLKVIHSGLVELMANEVSLFQIEIASSW